MAYGPASLQLLDLESSEIEPVLEDPTYDFQYPIARDRILEEVVLTWSQPDRLFPFRYRIDPATTRGLTHRRARLPPVVGLLRNRPCKKS